MACKTGVPCFLFVMAAAPLAAEVVDSSPAGFTVREQVTVDKSPSEVYRRIFEVSQWWSSAHSWSGDAKNLSMEERAGGCFCEKLPDGGGVKHMELVSLMPGKKLVLVGSLGPLQSVASVGTMTIELAAEGKGTALKFTYAVAGYLAGGLGSWAGPVDGVLAEQVGRLKNLVEHGNPAPSQGSTVK